MGLTPEGLGKVNVSMDIGADGQLTARLAFDNPLAAADLRSRVDELRSQLQDAGFQVADDALSFTQQDASSSNGGDRSSDQRQSRAFASASRISAQADAAPAVPPAWVSLSLTPRGVDMKV
jgi:flagellar hook-length control protein FliK